MDFKYIGLKIIFFVNISKTVTLAELGDAPFVFLVFYNIYLFSKRRMSFSLFFKIWILNAHRDKIRIYRPDWTRLTVKKNSFSSKSFLKSRKKTSRTAHGNVVIVALCIFFAEKKVKLISDCRSEFVIDCHFRIFF